MKEIRLSELLGALSHALDLVEGQPAGHCVRCCFIGIHVGREIGLAEAQIWELYYTLLLKDLGCSSNAARICQLFLTDDLAFKHDAKTIDGSLPQALRFVLSHTGLKSGLTERFRSLVHVFLNTGKIERELIETRCHRGAEIARRMRFSEGVAAGIQNLDEHWDGSGQPLGLAGAAIPVYARIALLAQVVDVFQTANGIEAAHARRSQAAPAAGSTRSSRRRSPASPRGRSSGKRCAPTSLQQTIFALEPAQRSTLVDEDYLDDIAAAFAQVIDSKSPYTSGHSERVTLFTDLIAEQIGLARRASALAQARRAAARHRQARREQFDPRQAGQARRGRMGGDEAARRAHRDDPVAHRGIRRSRGHCGRAS